MITDTVRRAARPAAIVLASLLAAPWLLGVSSKPLAVVVGTVIWFVVPVPFFQVLASGRLAPRAILPRLAVWVRLAVMLTAAMYFVVIVTAIASAFLAGALVHDMPRWSGYGFYVLHVAVVGVVLGRWSLAAVRVAVRPERSGERAAVWSAESWRPVRVPVTIATTLFLGALHAGVAGEESGRPALVGAAALLLLLSGALLAAAYHRVTSATTVEYRLAFVAH